MSQLIQADSSAVYNPKEAAAVAVAIAWVVAIGGLAIAALIICGWRGAKQATMDWLRGKATIVCR